MAGSGGRQREFMRWPAYEKMYISAFERMLDVRKAKGLPCDWQTGMDVFRWWMEDDNVNGQLSMDDLMGDNNVLICNSLASLPSPDGGSGSVRTDNQRHGGQPV